MHVHENFEKSLAELKELAEREKVALTPEVRAYIHEHVRKAQDKLAAGKNLTATDLAFIAEVRFWMGMPPDWRQKHPGMETVSSIMREAFLEAQKRHITVRQWLDLRHMAAAISKPEEKTIDALFLFPGNRQIVTEHYVELAGKSLTHLPENIAFRQCLMIKSCPMLKSLPRSLEAHALEIERCRQLTALPANFVVKGYLALAKAKSIAQLPEGLQVTGNLYLHEKIRRLPDNIFVGGNIYLPQLDTDYRLVHQIEQHMAAGKIKGQLLYVL